MPELTMPHGWGRVPFDLEARQPHLEVPFDRDEYDRRLDAVRYQMDAESIELCIVHGTQADVGSVRYLSNFVDLYGGNTVIVIPLTGAPVMITDAVMHGEPMHSGIQGTWIEDVRACAHPRTADGAATVFDHLAEVLSRDSRAVHRIALAGSTAEAIGRWLQQTHPSTTIVGFDRALRSVRQFKSAAEIAMLRRAAAAADAALDAVRAVALPGATEYELAGAAYGAMMAAGAEDRAFPIAVASGARAGFKHLWPTSRVLQDGDMVFLDLGANVHGYLSDSSRGFVVGRPSDEQRRFVATQARIVRDILERMAPGVVIGDLAAQAQRMADDAGYGSMLYFRGHGVGTTYSDLPAFFPGSTATLEPGMTFAFEPMLVRTGFGTACWEDIYLMTERGVERLNDADPVWDERSEVAR